MDIPATEAATDRSVGPAMIGALIRNPGSKSRLLSKIRTFKEPLICSNSLTKVDEQLACIVLKINNHVT